MFAAPDSWRQVIIFIEFLWSYNPFNAGKKLSPGTVKIVFTPKSLMQSASTFPP